MRECDLRKVDDGAGDMVDVIAEDGQRDAEGKRLEAFIEESCGSSG